MVDSQYLEDSWTTARYNLVTFTSVVDVVVHKMPPFLAAWIVN
jgi:hypothetical protein